MSEVEMWVWLIGYAVLIPMAIKTERGHQKELPITPKGVRDDS